MKRKLDDDVFSILEPTFAMRSRIVNRAAPLILTFHYAANIPTRAQFESEKDDIFGWRFLSRRDCNVVSFSPIGRNSWYRDPAFFRFLENLDLLDFPERIAYGSSMGGYAAAAFAELLGVSRVLLLNPISTLEKSLAPFERRFKAEGNDWSGAYNDGAKCRCRGTLIYDPSCVEDSLHARRFLADNSELTPIRLIGAGHNVPRALLETGKLTDVVLDFIAGKDISLGSLRGFRDTDFHNRILLSSARSTEERARIVSAHMARRNYANGQFMISLRKRDVSMIELAAQALRDKGDLEQALVLYRHISKIIPSSVKFQNISKQLARTVAQKNAKTDENNPL